MADWPYNTARWLRLRRKQLAKHPLCKACEADGEITAAVHVDHVKRIEDGGEVWSLDNLQSLCVAHHSIKTMAFDMKGKDWKQYERRGCNVDGTPRDPDHPWFT